MPAYEIGLTAAMSCDAAVEAITDLLGAAPRRAVGS